MIIENFRILNFKGIEDATISLSPAGANIYTLVGLNESGKTTVLEAINSFGRSTDETKALFSSDFGVVAPAVYVPKHKKSNFTGTVSISARVAFDKGELEAIYKHVESSEKCKIQRPSEYPRDFTLIKEWKYESSDFVRFTQNISMNIYAKAKGERQFKLHSSGTAIWKNFAIKIMENMPEIIYSPTFLFAQPPSILLNPDDEEEISNKIYRRIIENVAKSLDQPLDVEKHIVNRIISEDSPSQKLVSLVLLKPDKQEQVNAALAEISSHLTATVFESWAKIFGGDFSGRELRLELSLDPSRTPPGVSVAFAIKDGTSTYGIGERSLGFRWFFSFLLFTLYRVSAKNEK